MVFFCLVRGGIFINGRLGSEEKRKGVVCCWVGVTEVVVMLLGGKGRLVAGCVQMIRRLWICCPLSE
jgi:hypothetical protein